MGTYETGNLKYRLIPGETENDKNLAIVIPGDYSELTEITIPERFTVTETVEGETKNTRYYVDGIGYKAFNECSNLATVTFNSKNASTMISDYAFAKTNISAITIPETVEIIGAHAFEETPLTEITIPGSVKSIGDYAFYKTPLTAITIPGSVKSIGDYAFLDTDKLKTVVLNEGLVTIGASAFHHNSFGNGYCNLSSVYIPTTVKSIGINAFYGVKAEQVNISDITSWLGIDFGNDSANPLYNSPNDLYLNGEAVTDLVIPDGITEIKPYAFCYGVIKSVTFNDGLQSIGNYAFNGCRGLKSVTFNEGLQSIGDAAFMECSGLKSVTFNEGLQSIGTGAFFYVSVSTISIPGSVVRIGKMAFSASAPTLTFESGSEAIELADNAFKASVSLSWDRPMESLNLDLTSLSTLTIGNSVTEIPAAKFKDASKLTSLTLGSSLAAIGDEAFKGCTALTEVIVPPSVETIGASAFSGNTKLSSIIMGHNVKNIGENAFYQCPAQTVSITAQTPPTAPDNTFSNYTGNLYVQGKTAAAAYYDADYCWYQFEGHVMIEPENLDVDGDKILNGKPGDTFQLTAKLYPEDVTLPQIFWRSTNPDIATVDANGLVTLHKDMSDIMAMAADDDEQTATCKIIAESLYANGPVVEVTVNSSESGVEDIITDTPAEGDIDFTAPVEVYNLQGVMVGSSLDGVAPGIYIVRQGNIVKKYAVN